MAPIKKTSNMLSPCSSAKTAQQEQTLSVPDWSLLPEEILSIISKNVKDCFDAIHARSVCTLWRSTFPFPSCLLRANFLPSLAEFPGKIKGKGLCSLERFPMFLFRVRSPPADAASPSEFFLGGIGRDKSEDHMELPSPIQCSVKVNISDSAPTLMNMLDCQILPLGHQYRLIDRNAKEHRRVAFLPLNKEGRGGEFVVLNAYAQDLLVLRSAEMRWIQLEKISDASCMDIVTFRGRFYAVFRDGDVFVLDPYSLKATPLNPSELVDCDSCNYLVPSGNDQLFLVEKIIPRPGYVLSRVTILRVSRLDEEAGKWVEVSELGDRVLFIGPCGSFSCSAKEFPDGCGLSGNSIVFIYESWNVTYAYKYGVHTGRGEDNVNCWRYLRGNRVTFLSTSPVVALRVERSPVKS